MHREGKEVPMSLAAPPATSNEEGHGKLGEAKRLGWLSFDLLEVFRFGGDGEVLSDLTDRQLRDSGIDLSQAGRGRAAACKIATIANLEGLR
jgi:hypothetical protein